jgi:hypothetical protein
LLSCAGLADQVNRSQYLARKTRLRHQAPHAWKLTIRPLRKATSCHSLLAEVDEPFGQGRGGWAEWRTAGKLGRQHLDAAKHKEAAPCPVAPKRQEIELPPLPGVVARKQPTNLGWQTLKRLQRRCQGMLHHLDPRIAR